MKLLGVKIATHEPHISSLNLLEDYPEMLDVKKSKNTAETDYLGCLCIPMFDILLSAGNNIIRLKSYVFLFIHILTQEYFYICML